MTRPVLILLAASAVLFCAYLIHGYIQQARLP